MNMYVLLNKIKNSEITENEIRNLAIFDPLKTVLLYAYYEINKLNFKIPNLLKQKRKEYENNPYGILVIKKLTERSRAKSPFFNSSFFLNLLEMPDLKITEIKQENDFLVKKIKEYKEKGDIKSALKICESPFYANRADIQYEHIIMLYHLGENDQILQICKNPNFQNLSQIQYHHIKLLKQLGNIEEALKI